jgi:hypothetical protein
VAVALDNDILQKLCAYGLIDDLRAILASGGPINILGAAPFIVRKKLQRLEVARIRELQDAFEEFLGDLFLVEPTDEELAFATHLEEIANREFLGFDAGESQLCAVAIFRGLDAVITGDKRAITAVEALKRVIDRLSALEEKLVCLEQLILGVIEKAGCRKVRTSVCALKTVDTALSICLKCWSPEEPRREAVKEALESYIGDLRKNAPSLLYAGSAYPSF